VLLSVWTVVDALRVWVEFSAQLNVCGVVMSEPSTVTWSPTGFDVTVTAVGAAP